jgi:hypothetical protein
LLHRASPRSGIRIAAQIVLAQQEEHGKIGEVQKHIRQALPFVTELTYELDSSERKRKYALCI